MQEYTEELYKKALMTQITIVVWSFISDILKYEVKWVLGSMTMNKASGGDGIPVEQFQTLRDDAVKLLQLIHQQITKLNSGQQDWKRSVFIPTP